MEPHNIFVTVGSTDFDPLVRAVDELMPSLCDAIGTMQIGHGHYLPANTPYFRFAPSLRPYYEKASLVIAHGGLGTTMEVLKRGIPLVSVSNQDRFDRHQDDLLESMAEAGYLCWCRELTQLQKAIADAQARVMRRYEAPECGIHTVIDQYLKTHLRKR